MDNVNLPDEEKVRLSNVMDIASIVATEILARRKGFRIEETDLLRIKTRGRLIDEVPLYEYEGKFYILLNDKIVLVPLKAEEAKPEKPKKRLGKGGIKLP